MAGFLDAVRFVPVSSGLGDFVVSLAITGYQTPATAGAVDGTVYRYRAENADLSQWEIGYGAYATGTTTQARTTVLYSSAAGAKVNFTNPPNVGIVLTAEDMRDIITNSVLVGGTASVFAVPFEVQSSVEAGFVLGQFSDDDGGAYSVYAKSRGATVGANGLVQDGDTTGTFYFQGNDGTNYLNTARFISEVAGTSGTNDMPGRLRIGTTPDGAAQTVVRLTLNPDGEININRDTTVPAAGADAMSLLFGTDRVGIYVGSGVPTVAANTGSIYLRTDGTTTTTRLYVRTNSGTWATFTASA